MRRRYVIVLAVSAGALLALVGAAWGYERSREDTVADGVRIAGVDVGGLERGAAERKLERELLNPLQEEIVLRRWKRSWRLSAREARITADIEGSVDAALRRSSEGSFLTRAARDLGGGELNASLEPRMDYSQAAVVRLVDRVRRDLNRDTREARVSFGPSAVDPVPSRDGWQVRARQLHREVDEAILSPSADRAITVRVRRTHPKVTTESLSARYPTLITVDRERFRLTLFKNLRRSKTYRIAVGQAGLETPAGTYSINDKQTNPVWHVPKSDWAGKLAGKTIQPGPDNPIKARWMGFYDGAGIHGTDALGSLGTAASHGCVRMAVKDVVDLYDRVDVGTLIHVS